MVSNVAMSLRNVALRGAKPLPRVAWWSNHTSLTCIFWLIFLLWTHTWNKKQTKKKKQNKTIKQLGSKSLTETSAELEDSAAFFAYSALLLMPIVVFEFQFQLDESASILKQVVFLFCCTWLGRYFFCLFGSILKNTFCLEFCISQFGNVVRLVKCLLVARALFVRSCDTFAVQCKQTRLSPDFVGDSLAHASRCAASCRRRRRRRIVSVVGTLGFCSIDGIIDIISDIIVGAIIYECFNKR